MKSKISQISQKVQDAIVEGQIYLRNRYYKGHRQPSYQWKHKGWREKVHESMENNPAFHNDLSTFANPGKHNRSNFAGSLNGELRFFYTKLKTYLAIWSMLKFERYSRILASSK